jgi:hypothetical protein
VIQLLLHVVRLLPGFKGHGAVSRGVPGVAEMVWYQRFDLAVSGGRIASTGLSM